MQNEVSKAKRATVGEVDLCHMATKGHALFSLCDGGATRTLIQIMNAVFFKFCRLVARRRWVAVFSKFSI